MSDAQDHQNPSDEDESTEEIDWDRRILCSDENCIGVVGRDGRCKECGKPYEGELPAGFSLDRTEPPPASPTEAEGPGAPPAGPVGEDIPPNNENAAPAADVDDDSDWENRTLCSDGNCIGVIGPDGRCKECGKPYQPDGADGEQRS
jgi:hypothetical protein